MIAMASDTNDPNQVKPHQAISPGPPPKSPARFDPDPNKLVLPRRSPPATNWSRSALISSNAPPTPQFNPDPGASLKAPAESAAPFFTNEVAVPSLFTPSRITPEHALPRLDLRVGEINPPQPSSPGNYGQEPLPLELELPRENARRNLKINQPFHVPKYSLESGSYPTNTQPHPDRWHVGFMPWKRYTSGVTDQPYETPDPLLWHPYKQSVLKGDAPVIGQDIFLNLTASSLSEIEFRRIPTPSGISANDPGAHEFYGRSEQIGIQNFLGFSMELFKGETVFKPVTWAIKLEPVFNVNYLNTRETGVVSPDPRRSTERTADYLALQQAFGEVHLHDLSDNYDFIALRVGNQPFNSDFRGFLFNDINLGARFFGNWQNNRFQYNIATFPMREKDTYSDLNTFDDRNQEVVIANFYWQDFLWKGYTAQWSVHANFDHGRTHYDRSGNLVRPSPLGTVISHDVNAYYLGWAGDGHVGRINVSHAYYEVFGRDSFNGLAGRPVDIHARMSALELSCDRDWMRYKASLFYASGDGDPEDGTATGFDTILDNPNFTGGPFSYWARQGFNLGGTAVGLKPRNSLVPNLRSSKAEGQANFVNPGVFILGLGTEMDVTPKLKAFVNANYILLAETEPIKTALLTDKVNNEIGWDLSLGFQYRPLLTDNIIISTGFGALIPGRGFRDIYRTNSDPVPGFDDSGKAGRVDGFLYSAIFAVTFTY
jgi:hypothetical protein